MKKLFLLLSLFTLFANAQVTAPTRNAGGFGAGFTNNDMAASAIIEARSTSKGVLFPRMTTTQRNAISSPATSLIIFNTTTGKYNYYTGSAWAELGASGTVNPTFDDVLSYGNTATDRIVQLRNSSDANLRADLESYQARYYDTTSTNESLITPDGIHGYTFYSKNPSISTDRLICDELGGIITYSSLNIRNDDFETTALGGTLHSTVSAVRHWYTPDHDGTLATTSDITATNADALKRNGSNANSDVDLAGYGLLANTVRAKNGDNTKYVALDQTDGVVVHTNNYDGKIASDDLIADEKFQLPNKGGAGGTLATMADIAASSTLDGVLANGNTSMTPIIIGTDFDNGLMMHPSFSNISENSSSYIKQVGFSADNFYSLLTDIVGGVGYQAYLSPYEGLGLKTGTSISGTAHLKSDLVDHNVTIQLPNESGTLLTSAGLSSYLTTSTAASTYAPLASPTFTGTVSGITKSMVGLSAVPNTDFSVASNLPSGIDATKIGTGVVSNTELGYVDGVTSAIQTQLNGKQASLSGTGFIKASGSTISYDNSTYLTANQSISFTPNAGGDITGSSSGATSLTPLLSIGSGKVTSTHILDGTITNADISSSAAIDASKIDNVERYFHRDGTTSAAVNATSNTILTSKLLTANTLATGSIFEVLCDIQRVGANAGCTYRIYTNTSNSLTGATQLATYTNLTTQLENRFRRTFCVKSGSLIYSLTSSTSSLNDLAVATTAPSSTSFNPTVDNWIIIAVQPSNASDTFTAEYFTIKGIR